MGGIVGGYIMTRTFVTIAGLAFALLIMGYVAEPAAADAMTLVFERTWNAGVAGLAIGPDGSVYTVGIVARGEPPYTQGNVTLLRWSAAGDLLWHVEWGSEFHEDAAAVAVDAAGAAYVTGMAGAFQAGSQALLMKFDADGNVVWQLTWGGTREDSGRGVAIGPDGSVYLTGVTQSFGPFLGAAAFLLKFSPDGEMIWERIWQVSGGTFPEDIAVSNDGAVYLVGNHGCCPQRPFLAKFTADGALLWDRTFFAPGLRGGETASFRGIAVAPDGGVIAVGRWEPTFDGELLVVRFSSDGAILFVRDWGGDSHEDGSDVAVAADGTAYIVGRTNTFKQGSYEDIFVLKMLANGRGTEVRTWGGPLQDLGYAIALGPNGDLYIAGSATMPPYALDSAPSQMSRVRGASATDAEAVVERPAGTIGTPEGTTTPLDLTVGTEGGAVLLRIRPA